MSRLSNHLSGFCRGVFKILPMREAYLEGFSNHLYDYMDKMILSMRGATFEYSQLKENKYYLDIISSLQFLMNNEADIKDWKRVVLNACGELTNLSKQFAEVLDEPDLGTV